MLTVRVLKTRQPKHCEMNIQEFSRQLEGFREESPQSHDGQLEDDCILILGRLESFLEKMSGRGRLDDMNHSLEVGKAMLVALLDFVTQRFGSDSVARDLSRICELRDTIRDLQGLVSRAFWTGLFRTRSTHEELRQQAYRQVGLEFAEVFRDLLSVVDGHFASSQRRLDWQSSCRILIDEFRQQW